MRKRQRKGLRYCVWLLISLASPAQASLAESEVLGDVNAIVIEDGDYWVFGWACRVGSDAPVVLQFRGGEQGEHLLGSVSTGERSEPLVASRCDNQSMMQRFRFRIPSGLLPELAGWPVRVKADGEALQNSGRHLVPADFSADPVSEMLAWLEVHDALRILFVQAHADDEQHALPVLAQLCPRAGVSCDFAVATGGGSVTEAELRSLAEYIGGRVQIMLDLPPSRPGDSPEQVHADWSRHLGDIDLTRLMASLLEASEPDVVMALDPRHGVTCHPQHLAIGNILLEAIAAGAFPAERVVFASHSLRMEDGERWLGPPYETFMQPKVAMGPMQGATSSDYWIYSGDALAYQPSPGGPRLWDWQLDLMAHYQSQWAGTPYLTWLRPLHWNGQRWVGNDVSGRLTVLHRLRDFDPAQQPFADYCD